jgi:hypothetical protein
MLEFDSSLSTSVVALQPSAAVPDELIAQMKEVFSRCLSDEIDTSKGIDLDNFLLGIIGAVADAKLTVAQALSVISGAEFSSSYPASVSLVDSIWFWDTQVRPAIRI